MATREIRGYPVLILGGGRGGLALLEMFMEDQLVEVLAISDTNPDAAGIKLAKSLGVPTYTDSEEAMRACKDYPDCIVYNLTHDDNVAEQGEKIFGDKRVASGLEVKLFWQMVTNLKQIKRSLEHSQNQLQAVIHNAMDGIITINESGEIQGFNPAAEETFGYSQQEVLGKNLKMLMPEPHRSEHDNYIKRYLQTGKGGIIGVKGREVQAVRKNGQQFPMEISVSGMVLDGQRYFIGIVRDITERKIAEQKIAHLAHFDYLTDLPNLASFLDRMEQSVSLAKRNNYMVAILFLDLDGFKNVNDMVGHDGGNLLLQGVSKRLKELVRTSDTIARVGGDEFTVVLDDVGSDENASLMAKKIIAALSEPFDVNGQRCQVGVSIGISLFPDDSNNSESLLKKADEAMYQAKKSGKNTYKFHRDIPQQ